MKQAALTACENAANTHNINLHHIRTAHPIQTFLRQQVLHRTQLQPPSILTVNLAIVAPQLFQFHSFLPGVQLHYSLKCFPDVVITSSLAQLGASFD